MVRLSNGGFEVGIAPREKPMRIFYRLLCMFGRHSRGPRPEVWNDGDHFRSTCRGCDISLAKGPGGWAPLEAVKSSNGS
jgi:hypothetical protein